MTCAPLRTSNRWRLFLGLALTLASAGCGDNQTEHTTRSPGDAASSTTAGASVAGGAKMAPAGGSGSAEPAASGGAPTAEPGAAPQAGATTTNAAADGGGEQGTWRATSAILAGNAFPKEVVDGITLTITGENYEVLVGGRPDRGTCQRDESQTPGRMVITGTEGPNTGKTYLAIFEQPSDDELRICYDLSGDGHPGVFESTAENGYFLVTYARRK